MAETETYAPRDGESLEVAAYRAIMTWLLHGSNKAGATVSARELSRELGFSRTPVRTALARLEAQGALKYAPGEGFRVATPSGRDLKELFDLRAMCELHALADINQVATPETLAEMQKALDEMGGMLSQILDDQELYFEWRRRDIDFHRAYVAAADNRRLAQFFDQNDLHIQVTRAGLSAPMEPRRFEVTLKDHQAIIDAIRAKDQQVARAAAQSHIERVRDWTIALVLELPFPSTER